MRFARPKRALLALLQLAALLISVGVGIEVSLCPPGMDMGMEMTMGVEGSDHGPMDCPFGGSMDEEGQMSCPLAVGGTGPCGTSVATSGQTVVGPTAFPSQTFAESSRAKGYADVPRTIKLPPPRA